MLAANTDQVVHWRRVASLHVGAQELATLRESHGVESTRQARIGRQHLAGHVNLRGGVKFRYNKTQTRGKKRPCKVYLFVDWHQESVFGVLLGIVTDLKRMNVHARKSLLDHFLQSSQRNRVAARI
jgi:hypothetical protein